MPTADDRDDTFARLLADAEAAPGLVGVFVFGSRGRRVGVDAASDYDVGVIFESDEAAGDFEKSWPYRHGADVEVLVSSLARLHEHGAFGTPSEWARYQYAHADVVVDPSGDLARALDAKEAIPDDRRDGVVRQALGAYLNSTYRSLRYANRLDAAESIPPLLTTVFALEGRVRPFNKYLQWELVHHPLADERWEASRLLPLLEWVLDGDEPARRELFRSVEEAARAAGYGDEVDAWEPDLDWLRGLRGYRA